MSGSELIAATARRCGGGIGAGQFGEAVKALALERADQRRFDVGDQAEAAEHQRGIKLQQCRAGADFGERGRAQSMPPAPISGNTPSTRT